MAGFYPPMATKILRPGRKGAGPNETHRRTCAAIACLMRSMTMGAGMAPFYPPCRWAGPSGVLGHA